MKQSIQYGIVWLLGIALLTPLFGWSQGLVTGTVSDENEMPLPGATVVVEETNAGNTTDFDGNYQISASTGQTLIFSYVGYESHSVAVGTSSSIDVQLQAANELEEVIITALGLERETAELGYSVSKVDGGEISQRSEGDIGRLLIGKAAGLNITSSNGLSGSSTNITIRGYTSITGSNQPLFVVDGVPFGSDTNNSESFFDSATETSRFLDLDPNNIKEINILKGLSATALYGNRGRNGVILITTKNTISKNQYTGDDVKITVSSSAFWSNPHLADYQNEYGGSFDQEFGWYFSNWGPKFGTQNAQVFGNWLSEIRDGKVFLKHPFQFNSVPDYIAGYEELADGEYEYKAYESVPNFFRTGQFFSNSININGGGENVSYNVSYTKSNDEGFTPGNDLSKDNLSIGGGVSKNNLKINASLNYVATSVKSPPLAASRGSGVDGDGASIFGDLIYTPRNIDLIGLPYQRADGGSLYYRTSNSIQNPLWTAENSKTGNDVNRFYGNLILSYSLLKDLSINYRYGIDNYTEHQFYGQHKGGVDGETLGIYRTINILNKISDHNISVNYEVELSNKSSLSAIVGFNSNSVSFDRDGIESAKQIVFGTFKHWNFLDSSSVNSFNNVNIQRSSIENTFGFFNTQTPHRETKS